MYYLVFGVDRPTACAYMMDTGLQIRCNTWTLLIGVVDDLLNFFERQQYVFWYIVSFLIVLVAILSKIQV